jgi:hypothetical protein
MNDTVWEHRLSALTTLFPLTAMGGKCDEKVFSVDGNDQIIEQVNGEDLSRSMARARGSRGEE